MTFRGMTNDNAEIYVLYNFAAYKCDRVSLYGLCHNLLTIFCQLSLYKLCTWCDVITSSIPTTPPWLLTRPAFNFTLHCYYKSNTPPEIFKRRFYELCHEFKNYYRIFTDGSKEGNRVAAAVVHRDNTKCV